ncbi:MAG TPA: alkene reductase [Thermoanaerobaculia bacterium]|nr:alkene reductase [Thermoanaerobaculia bacterium]
MSDLELLSPVQVGPYTLRNRMVMAPMTRNRAGEGDAPTPLTATYYEQRSSAGLLVTEGSQVAPEGMGYPNTPGIYSDLQVEGWKRVTEAVHGRDGRIFLQLWHVGRASDPTFQPGGALPVAPSAIPIQGNFRSRTGTWPYATPRALGLAEIPRVVQQFAEGARRAKEAGFDGVEIHGANGYLIDQFLRDGTNQRTDVYGGSVENRARFLVEVTEAVAGVFGADRVGVRLSPTGEYNDMSDSDPLATFGYAAGALSPLGLAYLHVVAPGAWDPSTREHEIARTLRERFGGRLMLNGGFDRETGNQVVSEGLADLVSFGTLFLANPDLPERFAEGASLNAPDRATFYGGAEKGYIDYPTRLEVAA